MKHLFISLIFLALPFCASKITDSRKEEKIQTGAEQLDLYLPLLKDKRVGLIVNQTSLVNNTHLVDTLLKLNVNIVKIFAPEHGFRGEAEAGEHVNSGKDAKTNLPLVSLYGSNKKPSTEQLQDLDLVIFDIQDVGTRFFTYISTMHYAMEACAENKKEFLVLDRPNPNGSYVDGPILEKEFKSFVGMHTIPIVHGLTVGELAMMVNQEGWLENKIQCSLTVIKNKNYTHKSSWSLPVRPSPNLPNDMAINLYPSLCLFEGTTISVGRGTTFPFQVLGAPEPSFGSFTFTPVSIPGVAKNPAFENKLCYGLDLRNGSPQKKINLNYLIDFYNKSTDKEKFFIPFFEKLAGTARLREQIKQGLSENEIRKSWEPGLKSFKELRKKYLLYPDFE